MHGEQDRGKISRAYAEHRPYLIDLAFRMLGDIGAAEDTVQDAFWRLMRRGPGRDRGRAGLADRGDQPPVPGPDQVGPVPPGTGARRQRDRVRRAVGAAQPPLADPADRVTFDDGVRLALLAMLQRLSPAERVVFVLHDIFQLPFAAVAETVGRPAPACRQLASRARQKIAAAPGGARFDVASAEHRLVTEKFIAACATGDLGGLLEVLAPDAWGEVDLGPAASRCPACSTALSGWPGTCCGSGARAPRWSPSRSAGSPRCWPSAAASWPALIVFTMRGELIQAVHVIGDPRKLGFVSAQLVRPAVAGRHYPRALLVLTGAAAIRRPASARAMPGLARKASTCSTSRSSSAAPGPGARPTG